MKQLYLIVFFLLVIISYSSANNNTGKTTPPVRCNTGVTFIENKGQVADVRGNALQEVLFVSNAAAQTFFFRNSFSYLIVKKEAVAEHKALQNLNPINNKLPEENESVSLQRIDVEFVNSNASPVIEKGASTNETTNYYLAQCGQGVHAASFESITYKELYNGIDVVFKEGAGGSMEYDFILKPGANPNDIQMKYTGADVSTADGQTLTIKTIAGEIQETIPQVYEYSNGTKTLAEGKYVVNDFAAGVVSFKVSAYNKNNLLVIDPWITYVTSTVGGNNTTSDNSTYAQGVTLTPAGNVIVQGYTNSGNFPTTPGVFQPGIDSGMSYNTDIFVAEFDTAGHRLWATYYGGSNYEFAYPNGVCTDAQGNIIFTAETRSTDFPVTAGALQSNFGGGTYDAVVVKLDGTGNRVWGTYLGGNQDEFQGGVATDAAGNIVLTGGTKSPDFPVSAGAFQPTNRSVSYYNSYIVKLNAAGALKWSTYFGGTLSDEGQGIATDKWGNVILASTSCSTDYPVTAGAYQTTNNGPTGFGYGSGDVVLAKFDSVGNRLWATYYGSTGQDGAMAVTTDVKGNIFFTGATYYSSTFPTTPGVFKPQSEANGDAIAVKFSADGKLVWSTLVGGTRQDLGSGITVGNDGFVYLCGITTDIDGFGNSAPEDFPVTPCAYQTTHGTNGFNWWFAKLDSGAQHLCYSSYLGGVGYGNGYSEHCNGLAFANNTFYLCGYSQGHISGPSDFPVTPGAFETTPSGTFNNDGVLAAINISNSNSVNFTADKTTICTGGSISFTSTVGMGCNSLPAATPVYTWHFAGGTPDASTGANPANIVYNTNGVFDVKLFITTPCATDSLVMAGYITVSGGKAGTVTATPASVCAGSSSLLTATGSGGAIQWQSSDDSISFVDIAGATSTAYNTVPLVTNIYYRIKTSGGCGADSSAIIKVVVNPSFAAGVISSVRDTICTGTVARLEDNGSEGVLQWQSASINNYTNISGATDSTYSDIAIQTTYYRVVAGAGTCADTSATFRLVVVPAPIADFDWAITGHGTVAFNNSDPDPAIFHWDFADGDTSNLANPAHVFDSAGTYHVCLTIKNNTNCNYTTCHNVIINPLGIKDVGVQDNWKIYPNPFSNNIYINCTGAATIEVYNTLGQLLLRQDLKQTHDNIITVDGSGLSNGVYYLKIKTAQQDYVQPVVKD